MEKRFNITGYDVVISKDYDAVEGSFQIKHSAEMDGGDVESIVGFYTEAGRDAAFERATEKTARLHLNSFFRQKFSFERATEKTARAFIKNAMEFLW